MSKNTRTRILLVAVASLLLVVMAVGGTIAYLQDKTQVVTNTFHTSNVDITLQEHPVKADGKTIDTSATPVTEEDEYKMVPGDTLQKDPWVTVINGSEACYVFVKVEVANNTYTGVTGDLIKYEVDTSVWTPVDNVPGVYYKKMDAMSANSDPLYILKGNAVTVNSALTNAQMDAIAKAKIWPELKFTAYAIQQIGFDTPAAAWTEVSKLQDATNHYVTGDETVEGTK